MTTGFTTLYTIPSEWVPMKNRLPDKSCSVMVWGDGKSVLPAYYYHPDEYEPDTGFFVSDCGYDGVELEEAEWATHWMPFPEPPQSPVVLTFEIESDAGKSRPFGHDTTI